MDVRCERCKTEYEFDDARITETGVTVKCTTCGHVFKVKKKALVVTVPVKPSELDQAHAPLTQASLGSSPAAGAAGGGADKSREWKVRQANGNIFTFKELTTLQKWIVERKVAREDEISLTGESWKRLGNIAELASFFQVVEDAQKAVQLSALQASGLLGAQGPLATPGTGYPAMAPQDTVMSAPAPRPITQPMVPVTTFSAAVAPPPPPAPVAAPMVAPGFAPVAGPVAVAAPPPAEAPPPLAVAPVAPSQPAVRAPLPMAASRVKPEGSGTGKWLGLAAAILAIAGAGFGGYQFWWLPQQALRAEQLAAAREDGARSARELAAAQAKAAEDKAAEAAKATDATDEDDEADDPQAVAAAPLTSDAGSDEEEASEVAAAPAVDAGAAQVASSGPGNPANGGGSVVPVKAKKEPVRSFDWYMAQGDRLRDRDKAEDALDAYGRAADLDPDRPEPIAGRGLALLDMGSKLQAEAAFQQALKANPRYPVAIMGLAETYKQQGKKDEAIKYYQRYLEVAPQGAEANVAKVSIQKLSE